MLLLRSILFEIWLWVSMAVIGIVFLPVALFSRDGAFWVMRLYSRGVLLMLRVLCGITYEIRGKRPTGPTIVASKHESMIDMMLLILALPEPRYVIKHELRFMPIFGYYAMRIGSVPVKRGKGESAVRSMVRHLEESPNPTGQIVIFPQGTRVAPGAEAKYKIGIWRVYDALDLTCTPAALNTGLCWGRRMLIRRPGHMVLEFLPPIRAGLEAQPFMERLEQTVETASSRLREESARRAIPA